MLRVGIWYAYSTNIRIRSHYTWGSYSASCSCDILSVLFMNMRDSFHAMRGYHSTQWLFAFVFTLLRIISSSKLPRVCSFTMYYLFIAWSTGLWTLDMYTIKLLDVYNVGTLSEMVRKSVKIINKKMWSALSTIPTKTCFYSNNARIYMQTWDPLLIKILIARHYCNQLLLLGLVSFAFEVFVSFFALFSVSALFFLSG